MCTIHNNNSNKEFHKYPVTTGKDAKANVLFVNQQISDVASWPARRNHTINHTVSQKNKTSNSCP